MINDMGERVIIYLQKQKVYQIQILTQFQIQILV